MSYSPGVGVDTAICLDVGHKEPVDLSVIRADRQASLVIGRPNAGLRISGPAAQIRLEQNHLETLRGQIPGVLADLGVLDAACEREADAGSRAEELEGSLQDQALAAKLAGKPERAAELQGMADKLKAADDALEAAFRTLEDAALMVDQACEDARRLLEPVAEEQPAHEGVGR
jgi:hypothetical protein